MNAISHAIRAPDIAEPTIYSPVSIKSSLSPTFPESLILAILRMSQPYVVTLHIVCHDTKKGLAKSSPVLFDVLTFFYQDTFSSDRIAAPKAPMI